MFVHMASATAVKALALLVVVVGAFSMTVPFLWMFRTSLMQGGQADLFPPVVIPNPVMWHHYIDVFQTIPMALLTLNSVKVTVLSTLGVLFSSSCCGFGFSRLRFRGRDTVFLLVLLTMMIPRAVTLIPLFILFTHLGWIDTLKPLIVPAYFGGAFSVFLMRQFFLTLPQPLFDAATVDGADPIRQFWHVALPLSVPALATVGLFNAVSSWGDLLGPLIYLNSQDKMTLPVGLLAFKGQYVTDVPRLMAASAMVALPMMILFIFTQRYFVQGIALTGIHGS